MTRQRRSPTSKSYALLCDLGYLFRKGEDRADTNKTNASKYTAETALAYLQNLVEDGRRKYRVGGKNGNIPTLTVICSWFSGRASGSIKPININLDKYDAAKGRELRQMCEEQQLPMGKKIQLVELLFKYDIIEGLPSVSKDYYSKMDVKNLQELCKDRNLPSSLGSVPTLRLLLKFHDMVAKLKAHEQT